MNDLDAALIQKSLAGDAGAFDRLYRGHAARVKAYFLRTGFADADADDLLQAVFVRVFKSLGTFDAARGAFGAWLATVARNVARRAWQKRPQPEHFDPLLAEETLEADEPPQDRPESREETQAVRAAIAELPDELATVVRLRYVDGRTTRGVAAATGIPESTVRLRLDEARAQLARLLSGMGVVE